LHDFEAITGLQYLLSTLHERRCRCPCKTRFRLAGSAFTGRASNPLGHDERFQVTSILLSRTCPDASWAHCRRKLFDVFEATKSPIAEEALRRIQQLYAIEAEINGKVALERLAARQVRSVPLLRDFHTWCEAQRRRLSTKSTLGKALQYALSRWEALTCYTTDGRLSIDNNLSERLLRGIAVSRKNFLFLGSDQGGTRAAVIYTLIESAKLNGLNPEAYLAAVVDRMAKGHPNTRLAELLPWSRTADLIPAQTRAA
jgi:transposase